MITEIAVPSYFGSLVQNNSNHLPYDIFQSNWLFENRKYKINMMILVERTLRPMRIIIGNIFILDMSTFLKVRTI